MFKEPEKHRPREWGQRNAKPPYGFIAAALAAFALLFWLSLHSWGEPVAYALMGVAATVTLYRHRHFFDPENK